MERSIMETSDNMRIEQEIREMERKWDASQLHPEMDLLDRLMADEYVAVLLNNIYTKAEVMQSYRSTTDVSLEHYHSEIDRIIIHGDVAIVVGRSDWRGKIKRSKVKNHAVYSRAYVHKEGRWQVTVSHITVTEA
jgi:ketosteroid isomerase-like protein